MGSFTGTCTAPCTAAFGLPPNTSYTPTTSAKKMPSNNPASKPLCVIGPIFQIEVARRLIARVRPEALLNMSDTIHVESIDFDFLRHE